MQGGFGRLSPRWIVIVLVVLIVAAGCADWSVGWGTYTSAGRVLPGASWRPYASASPFNQPVEANPRVASNEETYARTLEQTFAGFSGGGGSSVYFAVATDPDVTVSCGDNCPYINGQMIDVPANALPDQQSDAHITIIEGPGTAQPNYVYECWQGSIDWTQHALDGSSCDRAPINGDGMLHPWYVTAGGISKVGGEVWPSEFHAAKIQHALVLNVPCVQGHSYPVTVDNDTSEPDDPNVPCAGPWLGGRVWLDLTQAQISAIPDANARTLAQALHDYGAYIRDSGNPGSWEIGSVGSQSWTRFGAADPWSGFARIDASQLAQYWGGHLHILQPCVAQRTC
jgi:hypothetical protein